jgi:hypothetical protein
MTLYRDRAKIKARLSPGSAGQVIFARRSDSSLANAPSDEIGGNPA